MMRLLAVLDIGEIVDEETNIPVATFDPTEENVAQWEDWVETINIRAREYNAVAARSTPTGSAS